MQLFDDYKELCPRAAAELSSSLHRMQNGSQSHRTSQSRGLQFIGQSFSTTNFKIYKLMVSYFKVKPSKSHNRSQASSSSANITSLPNSNRLFLLNCIGYGRCKTRLSQQQLEYIRTDRQLFLLMRGQYLLKHWWRRLQLFRTLIGLDFVQSN